MSFLSGMSNKQIRMLLTEMAISKKEDIDNLPFSVINGILHVTHSRSEIGIIESIYHDFDIIKIYNGSPSSYDQKRYENYMSILLEKENYRHALIEYKNKNQ